jgi:alpha-L-fucosidase
MAERYEATWESLREHRTPRWYRDAKLGIYTHWGVYSVPAKGPNVTWYPYYMYRQGSSQHEHHVRTYGGPEKFGYKDFIPLFTGEKFDPDEWADLFKRSGARYAGPVGEHHDGFCMWDTKHGEWNAVRMGPRRDVVGLLSQAIRAQGMRFMVALHHAENWWFFPHWNRSCDTADPRYAGLYGEPHDIDGPQGTEFFDQDPPSRRFLETWKAKVEEVVDRYRPDLLWFDFALKAMQENYRREAIAYYYSRAEAWGREVVVNYKYHDLAPGSGVVDLELGRYDELNHHDWVTDTTVDDGSGWGYNRDATYKPLPTLIHYLVDNISKNGNLLLNVGPKPDGEIPAEAKDLLTGIGRWLEVNGEAVYGTAAWTTYGEGPTKMKKAGYFMEDAEVHYGAEDVRFTCRGDVLYAFLLGWPRDQVTIKSLGTLYPSEIVSVRMLGVERDVSWSLGREGLTVRIPQEQPCEHAFVLRIQRKQPFSNQGRRDTA